MGMTGLAIFQSITACNLVGERLRDTMDAKLFRQQKGKIT